MRKRKRNRSNKRSVRKTSSQAYGALESRRLLAVSVTLQGDVLTIMGDGLANDILVSDNGVTDTFDVTVDFGGENLDGGTYDRDSVASIDFTGRSGDDIMRNSTSLPMIARGNAGDDTFFGGEGVDQIFGGNGNDGMFGSGGNDILNGNDGADSIFGGAGDDLINGGPENDGIFGGEGDDTIYGERGDDVIHGDDGDDTVYAFTGEDVVYGNAGNDFLYGQAGDDRIHGGDGADRLRGNPGNDDLRGEAGDDFVKGDQDDDEMDGGEGNDTMHGWGGNDRMMGGAGDDGMFGQDGDDYITGGDGNDTILGGNDNDRLYGEAGADFVRGDAGLDGISGGLGTELDRLFGSEGSDRFLTEATDMIMDQTSDDAVLVYENDTSTWNDAEIELMDNALEVMHHRTGDTNILSDLTTNENLTFTKVADIAGDAFGSNTLTDNGGTLTRSIQFEEFDETGLFDKRDFTTSVYVQIGRNWDTPEEFGQIDFGTSGINFDGFMELSSWTPESEGNPGTFFSLSNDGQWYYDRTSNFTFANDDSDPEDNPSEDFATTWEYYFDTYSNDRTPVAMQEKYDWFDAMFSA